MTRIRRLARNTAPHLGTLARRHHRRLGERRQLLDGGAQLAGAPRRRQLPVTTVQLVAGCCCVDGVLDPPDQPRRRAEQVVHLPATHVLGDAAAADAVAATALLPLPLPSLLPINVDVLHLRVRVLVDRIVDGHLQVSKLPFILERTSNACRTHDEHPIISLTGSRRQASRRKPPPGQAWSHGRTRERRYSLLFVKSRRF